MLGVINIRVVTYRQKIKNTETSHNRGDPFHNFLTLSDLQTVVCWKPSKMPAHYM